MPDIDLEDLMQGRKEPPQSADTNQLPVETAAALERQTMQLTPEERRQVDKIRDSIDLRDNALSVTFGAPAQKKIADFSDQVLAQVRAKDSGEVGKLLTELVGDVRSFQPEEEKGFLRSLPIFGKLMEKKDSMQDRYATLSTQVTKIQTGLEQSRLKMMKDVARFDRLYDENVGYFKQLQLYIQAGEEKIHEMRTVTLPKLHMQAETSGNPMAVQAVSDFEANVNRFEKKVHDLKISKTIAIQTAPQIRLLQNNDKALIDRIQTAIYSTIPLWKNQLVIAIGLQSQQQVLQMQQAVNKTTNDLLLRNAEMLQQNSVETARENERSIVDIETVRKVNDKLIQTIEETVKIQQDGRAKRQAAEQELVAIEGRLRDTLLKYSRPQNHAAPTDKG